MSRTILTDLTIPYFCSCIKTYLKLVAKSLLCCLETQSTHYQCFLRIRGYLLIAEGVPFLNLIADTAFISILSLKSYSLFLLLSILSSFLLLKILVGNIEHPIYIFASGSNRIEWSALRFHGCSKEGNIISFEELKNIRWHLRFHLMKLFVLCWSIHLKRLRKSLTILRLTSKYRGEPTRMWIHGIILLHL